MRGMKTALGPPLLAAGLLLAGHCVAPGKALAHSVYIAAWVDGDQVCTESSFSTKSRARNSTVTVLDAHGNVLHEGMTGDNGTVCFPLPDHPMQLTYTVNAGQGHRAETVLYAEDFPDSSGQPALSGSGASSPRDARPDSQPEARTAPQTGTRPDTHSDGFSGAVPAELEPLIRAAVKAELQSQLGPIRQSLAALQTKGPGLVEIFGGIGWIAGLAGVAMMAAARRRKP